MAKTVDRSNLGYLGQEFQFKLVKCFIEDQKFFINIQHIIDQNMFTDENLRRIVGFMKDRYNFTETVTTYSELKIIIRSKIMDAVSVEMVIATLDKIEQYDLSGMDIIQDEAERFFKQQNLTRAINKAQEIIKKGDGSNYYQIEDLVKKALEVNTKQEFGWRLFENIESDLSEDYRITIPTGATKLDEALYGGLGKGELGIVIAPLGTGKAQPLYSKVLTTDGYKTMGEMKVGMKVVGRNGEINTVIGVFPQGIRPIYEVSLSDGSFCRCDIEHLWLVNESEVITLKEIIDRDYKKNQFSIPKYCENTKVYIENIEYICDEEAQCIMIDSEDHLYITDNYIITHNTSCTTGFAAAAAIAKTNNNNNNGFKVLHFYFEDDDANIRRKYYGYVTDIDACDLSTPEWRPIAIERLNEDSDIRRMLHDNIMGERLSTGEVTASEIKRKIKSYIARGFKPDLVIVDYFECIKPEKSDDFGASEWSKEGISMRKLESTAKELNIAIWVPVQGTKDSIGAEIVGVNQAGGSVKKTQIGHVVITLAQTPEQKVQGKLNMFIGKLRAARIGRNRFMNIGFNNGTLKFDMSECDEEDDFDKISDNKSSCNNKLAKEIRDYERKKRML